MGLQIWLSLTKDLHNQGLFSTTVINNGATYETTGKVGGCYNFVGSKYAIFDNPIDNTCNEFSICAWVYPTSTNSSYLYVSRTVSGDGYGIFLALYGTSIRFSDGSMWNQEVDLSTVNKWYHLCFTKNSSEKRVYVDGELVASTTTVGNLNNIGITGCIGTNYYDGRGSVANNSYIKVSDFRIYDNCLSEKEIKEISKGLILHYPLNSISNQTLDNCYSYPTFDTDASAGGWNHWAASGGQGSYGQTTDKTFIFNKNRTYAHWYANAAAATNYYILYQSPAFDGGYRSLQCIVKRDDGEPITNSNFFPGWNAHTGNHAKAWDEILNLGNGFYLCKCNGFQQDGSNDLVCMTINPGNKVYVSEAYLENNKKVCSDILFGTNKVYDYSGLCNNGILEGNSVITTDAPKYSYNMDFNTSNYITINPLILDMTNISFAVWVKWDAFNSYSRVWDFGQGASGAGYCCFLMNDATNGSIKLRFRNSAGTEVLNKVFMTAELDTWYHIVFSLLDTTCKIYVNGELNSTSTLSSSIGVATFNYPYIGKSNWPSDALFDGQMSDFRIYATALSATDVLSLYQNNAYIDQSGQIYGPVR